jgi:hypothetical protein
MQLEKCCDLQEKKNTFSRLFFILKNFSNKIIDLKPKKKIITEKKLNFSFQYA